jgi:hypothetical protein
MSPQDEREAIARLAYSWSPSIHEAKTVDCESGGFVEASWEEVSDKVRGWFYDRADVILALRQPGAEYRRGVEVEIVAIREYLIACADAVDVQRGRYSGNVAAMRDLRAEAKAYRNAARMIDQGDHTAYRATAIRILPESTKGEGR